MPQWTPEQAEAISARGADLIVAAAAGSGKTAVLIERVLSLLREGVELERLLVVTFTNAAADEMRERLLSALEAEDDPAVARLAARVERAHIRTLHGFCGAMVREEFAAAGVDPAFRVADPSATEPLRSRAADAALDALLTDADEGRAALDALCGDINAYRALILDTHAFVRSLPDPAGWLAEAEAALSGDDGALAAAPWARSLARGIAADARAALDHLREAEEIAEFGGAARCAACAREDASRIEALLALAPGGMTALAPALAALAWPVWPSRAKEGDPESKKAAKDARDRAKKLIKDHSDLMAPGWAEHCRRVRATAPSAMWLGRLVLLCDDHYARLKAERLCADYDDLEHMLLRALGDPAARARISGRFDAMLVDECQDISRVQQALIEGIAPAGGLFQVGDVKQSIYRFRNADPGLFLAKQRAYSAQPGAPRRRIDLARNYRSRPAILRAVNLLFAGLMTGAVGEIDYSDGHALAPGRADGEGMPAALHILLPEMPSDGDGDALQRDSFEDKGNGEASEAEEPVPAQRREAELGAALIAAELGRPLFDPRIGGMRPARPRDIVVLLRAPKSAARAGDPLASLWMAALEKAGVPGYAAPSALRLRGGASDRVFSLLRAADNPRDDGAMIAAMRAMGLSADDLAAPRAYAPEGEFGDALRAYLADEACAPEAEHRRLAAFWRRLEFWRRAARTLPAGEAVRRILEDALDGPAEARFWAHRLASESPRSALGDVLERLLAPGGGGGDAPPQPPEDEDVVRIMSIHQSKGGQFPIVLAAGLGKGIGGRDAGRIALLHRDLGAAAEYVDGARGLRGETLARVAIRRRRREETRDEEMRLLYVAMTRAQEKLLLVASASDNRARRDVARWAEPPAPAHALCAADWVVPVAVAHPDAFTIHWHAEIPGAPGESLSAPPPEPSPPPRRLAYRHESASRLLRKVGVTRLSRGLSAALPDLPETLSTPRFLGDGTVTPARRGEAAHAVLRLCPPEALRGIPPGEALRAVCAVRDAAVASGTLPAAVGRCVPVEGIAAFWASDLGQRAARSALLLREAPFVRALPASALEEGAPDDAVLVQGVVDLAFIEDGAWILVDFKTDAAYTPERREASRRAHAPQLQQYAAALEAIDGRRVAEAVLWLVMPAVGCPVDLSRPEGIAPVAGASPIDAKE